MASCSRKLVMKVRPIILGLGYNVVYGAAITFS